MDYLFIFLLMLLGTAFHVMLKISGLRKNFPDFKFSVIWSTFFQQEWDSLMVSVLIIIANELILFIAIYNGIALPVWFDTWGMYVLALIEGYGGQALAYKWLNTAQKVLEDKADSVKGKF